MIDRGLSVAEVDGLLEVAGDYVDIVKLGWGTALVSANLEPKLERYASYGVPVVLGGTLTELAIRQGRVEGLIGWLRELRLCHVEVSDGTITLDADVKTHLIRTLTASGFTVLSEVGNKDADFIMAPYVWVEQIERDLEAGAWKVITEARESGTAGIYRADGEVRTGLIDEIAHAIDPDRLVFEAPKGSSRSGCSSASAPSAISATSLPTTCSRWRRCVWGCARTPSSASREAVQRMTARSGVAAIDRDRATRARRVCAARARLRRRVLRDATAQAHAHRGAALRADAAVLAESERTHQSGADLRSSWPSLTR